ncbi:MAG: redoxin domain-containing protein [Luteolibacter sp.]
MRIFFPLLLSASLAFSQTPDAPSESTDAPSPRTSALENLLAERESDAAFSKAVEEARKQGVKEQAIIEARFLYHVDRNEDAAIAAMLPDLLKQKEHFSITDSEIFSTEEDWLAVIEYAHAIDSLQKGDKASFKKHITEAFWLSPRQGTAFAANIERMRMSDAMNSLTIDFTTRFQPLAENSAPVSLSSLIEGKKALLLHFWSPWNNECLDSLPDYNTTAGKLISSNIAVVSVIPNAEPSLLVDARKSLENKEKNIAGNWIIDLKDKPFFKLLRIQSLPAMALVSPAGKVIYNGHPADDEFWNALSKIDPAITRPQSPENTKPIPQSNR